MAEHRSGIGTPYWYEWEIGLTKCLEMLTDLTISSVVLQSVDFKSLDDVVVNRADGSSCNIQVKHTDVDEYFTYSTLSSGENPMLKSWAEDWNDNKDCFQISEIHIVTNKKWGPNKANGCCSFSHFIEEVFPIWKQDYSYSGKNKEEKNAINWFKGQVGFLKDEAPSFVCLLSFEHEGNLRDVERKIEQKIAAILGTENEIAIDLAKNALFAELSNWSTSNRARQEIVREDVYKVLCRDSKELPRYELFPEKPVFPSRMRFADRFAKLIRTTEKRIVFLEGMPGSGKTSFVSYFSQMENSPVDFRFYTYLPVNKDYPSYSDDEGFYSGDLLWRSILSQIKTAFEKMGKLSELNFPLIYSFLTVSEMRETALKFLPIYADLIGRPCYLFIDGLDHAARAKSGKDTFLSQLPRPEEIGNSVKIVLVSQPINDRFPTWLSHNSQVEYIALPNLEQDDIVMLFQDGLPCLPGTDMDSLSQSIIEVVGNNALNVLFAIQEVKAKGANSSFDEIIEQLKQKKLNGQISRYYEWIASSLPDDALLQKIEFVFAFSSQKITLEQIALLCNKSIDEVGFAVAKLYPLVMDDHGYYYAFHNDVRQFFKSTVVVARNYSPLALTIRDRIMNEEGLGKFAYDVAFSSLFEMENSNYLLEFFSPAYIINSVEYSISVNRLLSQFESVANTVATKNDLDSMHSLSLVATALQQFLSCIHYYEKEKEYFENTIVTKKTKAEKYVLDPQRDITTIVHDVYSLILNGQTWRAEKLFEEYLSSCKLNDYLAIPHQKTDHNELGIYGQCGFICRHFSPAIMAELDSDKKAYLDFVDGWLKASIAFTRPEEIEISLSFRSYYAQSMLLYIEGVCKNEDVSRETLISISNLMVGHNVHIAILVELCAKNIISDCASEELIEEVVHRFSEIESDDTEKVFIYPSKKIPCYIKAIFCVYQRITDEQEIWQNYESILRQNHIDKETDRGYPPAIKQLNCAKNGFRAFYSNSCNIEELTETIYSLEYISNRFGTGSCHDCEAYSVRRFLIKLIRKAIEKEGNLDKVSKLCGNLLFLYLGDRPRYDAELAPLFYMANEKEKYLRIAQCWAGPNGLIWKNEYDEVEYYCESVVRILSMFNELEFKREVEQREKYRIISYSGHKDYSLNDLLEWYKALPLCPEKLMKWGVQLLSISDSAHEIGDNRMIDPIDKEVFRTSVDLGPQFVDALFELKNTPEDFFDWRESLLNVYYEKLPDLHIDDDELFSLYQIVNAWINVEIEGTKRNGYNRVGFLQNYNSKILELVADSTIRGMIEDRGYCIVEDEGGYLPSEHTNKLEWLLDVLKKEGYSRQTQEQIQDALKAGSFGQVDFLLSAGEVIDQKHIPVFVHNCLIGFILAENKYSMHENGLDKLIEKYSIYFSEPDWKQVFASVLSKATTSSEMFYCVSYDLEVLDLNYSKSIKMDDFEALLSDKMDLHWSLVTACGRINPNLYTISLDPNVTSIRSFTKKHIGK